MLIPSLCAYFLVKLSIRIWSFGNKNQLVKTYENDYVEKMIFTGGKGKDAEYAESEVARDYAIKNNVECEQEAIWNSVCKW